MIRVECSLDFYSVGKPLKSTEKNKQTWHLNLARAYCRGVTEDVSHPFIGNLRRKQDEGGDAFSTAVLLFKNRARGEGFVTREAASEDTPGSATRALENEDIDAQ